MKLLYLLFCCAAFVFCAQARSNGGFADSSCPNAIYIRKSYYEIRHGVTIAGEPSDIAVDWKTGDLFITIKNSDHSKTILLVKEGSHSAETIRDIPQTNSVAVDHHNGRVYFATASGLLRYKSKNRSLLPVGVDKPIAEVAVSRDGKEIYYTTVQDNAVFKLNTEKHTTKEVPYLPKAEGYQVDEDDNIFYFKDKVPYVLRHHASTPEKIRDLPDRGTVNFFMNKDDDIMAITADGILYKIKDKGNVFKAKEWGRTGYTDVSSVGFDDDDRILVGHRNQVEILEDKGSSCPHH